MKYLVHISYRQAECSNVHTYIPSEEAKCSTNYTFKSALFYLFFF